MATRQRWELEENGRLKAHWLVGGSAQMGCGEGDWQYLDTVSCRSFEYGVVWGKKTKQCSLVTLSVSTSKEEQKEETLLEDLSVKELCLKM